MGRPNSARWIGGLIFIFLAGALFPGSVGSEAPAEAEVLYQEAMNLLKESLEPETITKAIELLEKAAALDPGREEIWIQLSWRYWMLGDDLPKATSDEKKKRLELFDKGMAAGQKAIALNEKSVGGLYWFTVNMAAGGEMKGILSSLNMAGTLFANMARVDRRDPYYLYGATRRFGSEIFVRVPPWLTEQFGFKPEYIEEDLLSNIERWPHYFDNYVYLARVYVWSKQTEKALKMLEFVLSHPPEIMPEEKAENERQQYYAKKMWKEITGQDYPAR